MMPIILYIYTQGKTHLVMSIILSIYIHINSPALTHIKINIIEPVTSENDYLNIHCLFDSIKHICVAFKKQ